MFPPLALLHAGIGRLIADARIRTLPIARHHANATGYSGSRFPWESAFTGTETVLVPLSMIDFLLRSGSMMTF